MDGRRNCGLKASAGAFQLKFAFVHNDDSVGKIVKPG
jgi:hypothetical protein